MLPAFEVDTYFCMDSNVKYRFSFLSETDILRKQSSS